MPEYRVTIKAIISVDDPDTLEDLILCRIVKDDSNKAIPSAMDDGFEVIDYYDDWLDFTEIMRNPDINSSTDPKLYYINKKGE
jgi:hypothetical protein